ncbi:MAG: sugar ABC transporter permease [Lachnospiraceae bacterium]|nr:sugar ABC transporter permease [Lachnospiraceae bacterium]
MKNKKVKDNIIYFIFTGGAMAVFLCFVIYPMLIGLRNSFTDYDGISLNVNWVGLKNYIAVFQNKDFLSSISFTVRYTIVTIILSNVIGLALALALNMKLKTQSILRGAFFTPMMIGAVTVGFLWRFIFTNFFPYLGDLFGIEMLKNNILTNATSTFWGICFIEVWHGVGYMMLIYLAGLQSVPADVLESAAIDGTNSWQRFRHITLPLIRSSCTICMFLTLVNGLKVFDLPYSLTSGGPYGSTQSIAYNIYMEAFSRGNYSLATAESFVFCIIVGIVALIQTKVMNGEED